MRPLWLIVGTAVVGIAGGRVPVQGIRQGFLELEDVFLVQGMEDAADILVTENGERHRA